MAHRQVMTTLPTPQPAYEPQYQCACCEGVIENLSGETIPSGLDLKLNFISDDCLLICNACTLQLVAANKARTTRRRR